jgi:hypothetical protein
VPQARNTSHIFCFMPTALFKILNYYFYRYFALTVLKKIFRKMYSCKAWGWLILHFLLCTFASLREFFLYYLSLLCNLWQLSTKKPCKKIAGPAYIMKGTNYIKSRCENDLPKIFLSSAPSHLFKTVAYTILKSS